MSLPSNFNTFVDSTSGLNVGLRAVLKDGTIPEYDVKVTAVEFFDGIFDAPKLDEESFTELLREVERLFNNPHIVADGNIDNRYLHIHWSRRIPVVYEDIKGILKDHQLFTDYLITQVMQQQAVAGERTLSDYLMYSDPKVQGPTFKALAAHVEKHG